MKINVICLSYRENQSNSFALDLLITFIVKYKSVFFLNIPPPPLPPPPIVKYNAFDLIVKINVICYYRGNQCNSFTLDLLITFIVKYIMYFFPGYK